MPNATELTINTAASALDMANAIFGPGITVTGATFNGATVSSGIYSGANTTIPGISPSDSGVILSTGNVADFTNSSGTTNTNTVANRSTNTTGSVDGDAQLNAVAGMATFDGAILQASFIPDGDYLTMQFVFSSEEYPEYVNGNVNDSFGVWVNGTFVPVTITIAGNVAIDEINAAKNRNFYHDNTSDQYNTEMDGFTYTLSLKAPVNIGQVNTIKIGIADGGDAVYDSNLLIMGDSIQTVTLAFDDDANVLANSSRTFDILANDYNANGTATITQIQGVNVVAGQTVTLASGQQVRLNADGTITVFATSTLGSENFSYTVSDAGVTDVGYVAINTSAAAALDGIVSGTTGDDFIDTFYTSDVDGDRVDNNDATGVQGTTGHSDVIQAGAGNDYVLAGFGNDIIEAGTGNDTVDGGDGNDRTELGAGNDTYLTSNALAAGNDTVVAEAGNDAVLTGDGNDLIFGGTGNDSLQGGDGNDALYGGDDADLLFGNAGDIVFGGEGGNDNDTLAASGVSTLIYGGGNNESGTLIFADGRTLTFGQIEKVQLNGGNPEGLIYGTVANDVIGAGYVDANGDVIDNNDSILTNPQGTNSDEVYAGDGDDTVFGLLGDDFVYGGAGNDSLEGGVGNDYMQGDAGNDILVAGDGNDFLRGDAGNDLVYGGNGDDTTYGGAGNDQVFGGVGNDQMFGGFGDDTVYGGTGNDTITGSGETDVVYGEDGDDYIQGATGSDTLFGGAGNDTMLGEEDADDFYAGAGDYVDGYETVTKGTDNDTLYVTDVASVVFDTLNPENGVVTFSSGGSLPFYNIENVFVDGVQVFSPNFVVDGIAGDDLIDASFVDAQGERIDANDNQAGSNDDIVLAGAGNDTVLSGAGNDQVFAGSGQDSVNAGVGDDLVYGGMGNDVVKGDVGNDTLYGDDGDDTIFAGTGEDIVQGGQGNDLINLGGADGARDQVNMLDGDDHDIVTAFEAPINNGDGTYTGFDQLDVSDLTNASGAPVNVGDVTVTDDGAGNAVLTFSNGEAVTLIGISPAAVDSPAALVAMGIPPAPDFVVDGTVGSDLMAPGFVDAQGDIIDGADGTRDTIFGYDGNDSIQAGLGDDVAYGGTGDDQLSGGEGNDVLAGGDGADTMEGGNDRDTFFGGADDSVDGGEGGDDYDVLDLSAYTHARTNIEYTMGDPESGTVQFLDGAGAVTDTMVFSNIEKIIACFTLGSMIQAERGEVAVENLLAGDKVLTRDHGMQPVRWVGRRDLSSADLALEPRFSPIRIEKGALGANRPARDMLVSPQHRILVSGPRAELLFGDSEVLVAATHMVGMSGVQRVFPRAISYVHILFDQHQIVSADGTWSESFQPGAQTLSGLEDAQRDEVLVLFPHLIDGAAYPSARLKLKASEARVLLQH